MCVGASSSILLREASVHHSAWCAASRRLITRHSEEGWIIREVKLVPFFLHGTAPRSGVREVRLLGFAAGYDNRFLPESK